MSLCQEPWWRDDFPMAIQSAISGIEAGETKAMAFSSRIISEMASTARTIGIVAYDGVEIIDLTGPMEVFAFANIGFMRSGIARAPVYRFRVLSRKASLITASCGLHIQPDADYADYRESIDTLIVPGSPDVDSILADRHLIDWVAAQYHGVRRLVSICTGAFLLAEAGLLDGRCATSHWAYCDRLAADYPAVKVEADRIFLRDGSICTSGGITSGIDLALALLEEDCGREAALLVARYMVVFLRRPGGQSQFSAYLASEATNNADIRDLQLWIMEHPGEDLSLERLAARVAMSTRNFSRVFTAETGMTPAKFVEKVRVDAARHYLSSTDERIERTAVLAGFGDTERMRRAFLRHLGITPQDYRARFGPLAVQPMPSLTPRHAEAVKASLNRFTHSRGQGPVASGIRQGGS